MKNRDLDLRYGRKNRIPRIKAELLSTPYAHKSSKLDILGTCVKVRTELLSECQDKHAHTMKCQL